MGMFLYYISKNTIVDVRANLRYGELEALLAPCYLCVFLGGLLAAVLAQLSATPTQHFPLPLSLSLCNAERSARQFVAVGESATAAKAKSAALPSLHLMMNTYIIVVAIFVTISLLWEVTKRSMA